MTATAVRPTGVERVLGPEELIVSKTDAKGRITYANISTAGVAVEVAVTDLAGVGDPMRVHGGTSAGPLEITCEIVRVTPTAAVLDALVGAAAPGVP
jgi:hypothetical protein